MAATRSYDRNPELRAAGVRSEADACGTAECLTQPPRPPTPEALRRFHGTYLREPGARSVNYVTARDGLPRPEGYAYGVRTNYGAESAASVMKQPVKPRVLADAEQAYEEATFRGPAYRRLGMGTAEARGASLPAAVREPDYRFGVRSDALTSAKDLIQPEGDAAEGARENAATRELYKKSHRAYAPGEQVRTGLSMRNIDPDTHRFGAKAVRAHAEGGVAAALTWTNDVVGGDHTAVLVPAHMAELHNRTQPKVGVSRARALLETGEIPDVAFGTVSRTDDIGAGELIHNSLPEELLAEDRGLGKPEVPRGRPRGTGKVDAARVYGVPSIRSDVRPPGVRKLDDRQNYGDEKGAWELLNPSPYHPIGVTEDDFLTPLPRSELRDIIMGAGIDVDPETFNDVHATAAALDAHGLVSIETFRRVLDAYRARGMA